MPKPEQATAHFDAPGLLRAVQDQDHGLIVSTNNPKRWREILYAVMRAEPALRCHVYAMARSDRMFMLLKARPDGATGEITFTEDDISEDDDGREE